MEILFIIAAAMALGMWALVAATKEVEMKDTKLINDLIMHAAKNPDPDEAETMRAAAGVIREMREELLKKWIPVTEQIPKPFERVIVAREFEPGKPLKVEQGMLTEGGWWKVFGTNVRRGVLYWMPMPAAPEKEENQ